MLDLYLLGLDSWGKASFPDGGPVLDQPVKLVRGFGVIRREIAKYKDRG